MLILSQGLKIVPGMTEAFVNTVHTAAIVTLEEFCV